MKFARYLEETQTPEWKKAYIDYRGLKKHISVIQAAKKEHPQDTFENAERPRSRSATPPGTPHRLTFEEPPEMALRRMTRMSDAPPSIVGRGRGGLNRLSLRSIFPTLMAPLARSRPTSMVSSTLGSRAELMHSLPLQDIIPLLSPQEAAFFTVLDQQLDKVESFYCAREEEMLQRGHILRSQLNDLEGHRNLLQKTPLHWTSNLKSALISRMPDSNRRAVSPESTANSRRNSPTSPSTVASYPTFVSSLQFSQDKIPSVALSPTPIMNKKPETDEERQRGRNRGSPLKLKPPLFIPDVDRESDTGRYISARRKLKKAVVEHYRGLEMLDNYRIINQTGFRKILKKFEKHTKMPVQNQYMSEKVEKTTFASCLEIKDMMRQMEEMFAVAFLNHDKKKAMSRLRMVNAPQTHHLITFRVGLYLGLAIPALIDGLYKVSQQSTRKALPTWEVLLYLYSVLVLPVVFSLLVGLNLAAWASARINYVFIFELDVLSRIDPSKYFEIPAFLFATLVYSFWLTFCQPQLDAKIWPLIWSLFAVVVIINPLPVMHRSSRYWFLRSLGKQLLAGTRPVDFTDFWMGDQLCSMTFTLSHMATFVCAYVHHFQGSFPDNLNQKCGTVTNMWGVELILLCLPQAIRLVQSVKRYADSSINCMHLVNAGKYATGIIYTGVYLKWRTQTDDKAHEGLFVFWCLCGMFSSLYGCAWDLFMDWSLLSLRNKKYPLLRSELLYQNYVSLYYFAIVSNILLRFSWLLYVPINGPDFLARTSFVAMLELLRRFQWNFFRLENEHLGNVDQYRVTREVPLPYPPNTMVRDDDDVEFDIRGKVQSYRT